MAGKQPVRLIVLLALLTALGPLSTDMYLPSLPDIADRLNTDEARTQLSLSVFLFGFAAGMLIYGPIADRIGRKPVLLIGLGLFGVSSLVCFASPSIETLIGARFFQALGAAGPVVLARAIVRDLTKAEMAGRLLSYMGSIMGLVPAIAPILGGVLHEAFGWRVNFLVMAGLCFGLAVTAVRLLPETLSGTNRPPRGLPEIIRNYRDLLRSRVYLYYVLCASLSFCGLFAFISGSSFILQGVYGLSPTIFGLSFTFMVAGYIGGTLIGGRLTMKLGIDRLIMYGGVLLAAGGLIMTFMTVTHVAGAFAIILPMAIYSAGVGLMMPQSMAGALTPFPEKAGTASSLLGFIQTVSGALGGIFIGHRLSGGAVQMAMFIAAMGVAAFLATQVQLSIQRARTRRASP